MRSYAIVVVRKDSLPFIADILSASNWTTTLERNGWVVVVHSAHAENLDSVSGGTLGWWVDHDAKVLSYSAFRAPPVPAMSPKEGRYVSVDLSDTGLVVGGDAFRQFPILYSATDDFAIVSDSPFAISRVLRALGKPARPNTEAILARSWHRTVSMQCLSEETFCQDIRMCSVASCLEIKLGDRALSAFRHDLELEAIFRRTHSDYATCLKRGLLEVAGLMATLPQVCTSLAIDLSGGRDSRAVAAIASGLPSLSPLSQFYTSKSPEDAPTAHDLLKRIDTSKQMNPRRGKRRRPSWHDWVVASAGLHDQPLLPVQRREPGKAVPVGGHGGEVLRTMWNGLPLLGQSFAAPLDVQPALRAQLKKGFSTRGLSPRARQASEWHYLVFRNALHGSRAATQDPVKLSPLMNVGLAGLALTEYGRLRFPKNRNNVVMDMILLSNPALLDVPFASHDWRPAEKQRQSRRASLGPVDLEAVQPYEVVGRITDLSSEPSPIFRSMALDFIGEDLPLREIKSTAKSHLHRIDLPSEVTRRRFQAAIDGPDGFLSDAYACKTLAISALQ